MFTGIITDIGRVLAVETRGDMRARIGCGYDMAVVDIGASIACDGICLTVIAKGAVFRAIDRWGTLQDKALTPQAVNLIVKKRCDRAGLDPFAFSAHGLRSGFLTEAARRGVPLPEAMRQSQHRSVQQAARYYNDAEARLGVAARLVV